MFSLPDWAFYPIASLLVGGMIFGALSGGDSTYRAPEDILENGIVYDRGMLNNITLGNGLSAVVMTEDNTEFAQINAVRGPFDGTQSAGAFFTLTPTEIEALQGHVIQVTYSIRSSQENGASTTNLSFFIPGIGQDSWQNFSLTDDFTEFSVTVSPPSCDWDWSYAGMWPDWTVNANSIDLLSVKIEALEPAVC